MEQAWDRVAEVAPESWPALQKRAYDLRVAEKWAESEAVARQVLESGPLSLERAGSLMNLLFTVGRIDEAIELEAQVLALEPRWMWVSRDQQMHFYAAERFEEAEVEYERSQTLDGDRSMPNFLALLRGLARQDTDPQTLPELFKGAASPLDAQPQWVHDFGAAIPNRDEMLAILRRAFEAGEVVDPELADALGDRDLALSALRHRIIPARDGMIKINVWWQAWMLVHSGARADPRFKELIREAGLADYWRQSGKWPNFCGPKGKDDFECH